MQNKPKPPGNWNDSEDRTLRLSIRDGFSPMEAAERLNRLEKSVVMRARILGFPFPVKP